MDNKIYFLQTYFGEKFMEDTGKNTKRKGENHKFKTVYTNIEERGGGWGELLLFKKCHVTLGKIRKQKQELILQKYTLKMIISDISSFVRCQFFSY